LLNYNTNGKQNINIKAIYKKNHTAIQDVSVQKHNTITIRIEQNVMKLWINYLVGHQCTGRLRVISTPVFIEEKAFFSIEYLTPCPVQLLHIIAHFRSTAIQVYNDHSGVTG